MKIKQNCLLKLIAFSVRYFHLLTTAPRSPPPKPKKKPKKLSQKLTNKIFPPNLFSSRIRRSQKEEFWKLNFSMFNSHVRCDKVWYMKHFHNDLFLSQCIVQHDGGPKPLGSQGKSWKLPKMDLMEIDSTSELTSRRMRRSRTVQYTNSRRDLQRFCRRAVWFQR